MNHDLVIKNLYLHKIMILMVVYIHCACDESGSYLFQESVEIEKDMQLQIDMLSVDDDHRWPTPVDQFINDHESNDSHDPQEPIRLQTDPQMMNCESRASHLDHGMTTHFTQWLDAREDMRASSIGLALRSLARQDLRGGAFGGFTNDHDCIQYDPVLFVHGNSDRALDGPLGGWRTTLEYFKQSGYRSAELYATTYGPADPTMALTEAYQHKVEHILRIRLMIEFILEYTQADFIDIITHSLGTTITRRAILGGVMSDQDHQIDLGPPLTDRIDTFISIAGAHIGLSSCYFSLNPVCDINLGLYPGQLTPMGVIARSTILDTINSIEGYEGKYRVSLWSPDDELVGGRCLVWGLNTCQLPHYTHDIRLPGYSHLALRDQTVDLQVEFIQTHKIR